VVLQALAEHDRRFPPGPQAVTFFGWDGQLLRGPAFGNLWRRVDKEAEVMGRTFHSLRHYYASLLIRHGESVKTVQARLGHAGAAETLDTYSTWGPTPTTRPTRSQTHTSAPRRSAGLHTDRTKGAGQDLGPSCMRRLRAKFPSGPRQPACREGRR